MTLCLLVSFGGVEAQSIWTETDLSNHRSASSEDRFILPKKYDAYQLSYRDLVSQLTNTPSQESKSRNESGVMITLPVADGQFETFEVYEAPVMAPGLAAKYPMIKSYKGYSTTNKSKNVRFDTGPYGFHAAIHGIDQTVYIDPSVKGNQDEYLVYDVQDHISEIQPDVPFCGVEDDIKNQRIEDVASNRNSGPITMRVYRFALACTGEWGAIRGNVENALADMVTSTNRLNQIFENELAIRLVLVEDNDLLLNFDGSTDPYTIVNNNDSNPDDDTNDEGQNLGINTATVNSRIGLNNYDIGHLYDVSCNLGGLAALGSMCNNARKASALTCHYSGNLDFMAASVTSHEIGHQMTATHTMNKCRGNNESPGTGYEPGSGTTIMSYGGLCDAQNVMSGSDDYYHVASLMQIFNHTRNGLADACPERIETDNVEPEIHLDYEGKIYIPEETYFYLEGSATDQNDDQLTYTWEEFNLGPSSDLGSPVGTAPRFRSIRPDESPVRYFPSADNILNGQFDRTEVLPTGSVADMSFMFIVRDNNPEGGATVYEEQKINTWAMDEKFEVTSQNSGIISYEQGESMTVTWNVAETNQSPINTEFVDVLLNTNVAGNFDIYDMPVLASRVPNDGEQIVHFPEGLETVRGRVIVKAHDGIYFSINKRNVKVEPASSPRVLLSPAQTTYSACLPESPTIEIEAIGLGGLTGDIKLDVIDGLPADAVATFDASTIAAGESTALNVEFAPSTLSGQYNVTVQGIAEGVDTFQRDIIMYVVSDDFSALQTVTPVNGDPAVEPSPTIEWIGTPNADRYTLEIATSPSFGDSNVIREEGLTETAYVSSIILDARTVYYWRVIPNNLCGQGPPSAVSAFSTEVLECASYSPDESQLPLNISQSGTPTVEATIEVVGGSIADVNVTKFEGEHGNNKDLRVTLISPAGTAARMFNKICTQQDFKCQFDDASNENVKCPLSNGKTYRPIDPLAVFNGEDAEGTWTYRIEDLNSGNGGRLEKLTIEVCAALLVESPYVVRNNTLKLPWGGTPVINAALLEIKDEDNSSDELVYTVTDLPTKGQLTYDGSPVAAGDQFTQADVNNNLIGYTGASENYQTKFSFTVIDGVGGFLGVTNFNIEVDELSATEEEVIASEISIFPVPARDAVTVDLSGSAEQFDQYQVLDINGQVVMKSAMNKRDVLTLKVGDLPRGLYIINLSNDKYSIAKKLVLK